MPSSRADTMPTAANASLSSTRSRSASVDALLLAAPSRSRCAGCICRRRVGAGDLAVTRRSRRARSRPSSSALALLITTTAQAPSEICEAEPAVMVPSLSNAGRSLRQRLGGGVAADALVLRRPRPGRPCAAGSRPGRPRRRRRRSSSAAAARWCDWAANASCSSRVSCAPAALQLLGAGAHRLVGELVEEPVVGHRVDELRRRRT